MIQSRICYHRLNCCVSHMRLYSWCHLHLKMQPRKSSVTKTVSTSIPVIIFVLFLRSPLLSLFIQSQSAFFLLLKALVSLSVVIRLSSAKSCSAQPNYTSSPPRPECWPSSAIQKFPSHETSQLKASSPGEVSIREASHSTSRFLSLMYFPTGITVPKKADSCGLFFFPHFKYLPFFIIHQSLLIEVSALTHAYIQMVGKHCSNLL